MINVFVMVEPKLFYKLLNIALDNCVRPVDDDARRLCERLGEMFDPDESGQIIISQDNERQVREDAVSLTGSILRSAPDVRVDKPRDVRAASVATPNDAVVRSRIARASLLAKRSSTGELS